MRISDWSSDVCSSDLPSVFPHDCATPPCTCMAPRHRGCCCMDLAASVYPIFAPRCAGRHGGPIAASTQCYHHLIGGSPARAARRFAYRALAADGLGLRSEEHTSQLQSLMRTSYAVFCLKKNKTT